MTTLAMPLSDFVEARGLMLEGPDRIFVDFPHVRFLQGQKPLSVASPLINSWRLGLVTPQKSRLVIDLKEPSLLEGITQERLPDGGGIVLKISLKPTDRQTFTNATKLAPDVQEKVKTVIKNPEELEPSTTGSVNKTAETRKFTIVLDPGHGGIDAGASSSKGLREKDIVFSFAKKLRDKLEVSNRYKVVLTRRTDTFIPLNQRVKTAQSSKADLMISIHADTISASHQVRGFTVYTGAARASDEESARLAERENSADTVAGLKTDEHDEDVADILMDLTKRETRGFSHHFAKKLITGFSKVASANVNPHREARFVVLKAPDVPSVLLELGYLSSRQDMDLLMSDTWRDKSAEAVKDAIDRYFSSRGDVETVVGHPLP